jgi:hypothetical protein
MWQPIETVPKDGTTVDLWAQSLAERDRDDLHPCTGFRVPDACWWDGGWRNTDGNPHPYLEGFTNLRFTHWMRPPDPPKQN